MARNETVSDVFDEEKQFPAEWVKKMCGENVNPFVISEELIAKFNKLKCFNECANQDKEKVRQIMLELKNELLIPDGETISPEINLYSLSSEIRNVLTKIATFHQEVGCDGSAAAAQLCRIQLGTTSAHCQLLTSRAERNLRQLEEIYSQLHDDCQAVLRQIADNRQEEKSQKQSKRVLRQEINSLLAEKDACIEQHLLLSKDGDSLADTAAVHSQVEVLLLSLAEERREADALRSQLAKFGSLPTDVRRAQAQLKAEQKELQHLKGEIAIVVSSMGSGFM